MKEIVIDFRKSSGEHAPVYMREDEVELVDNFRFLGAQIIHNQSRTVHAEAIVKKAQQSLSFLRRVRTCVMPATAITNFYRHTTESIFFSCITVWYVSCSVQDCNKLQKILNEAQSHPSNQPPIH